jgi:protein-tyrosine-phosphatase
VDLSRHASQQLTSRHLAADWIFVMESDQASFVAYHGRRGWIGLLGDLDPQPIDTRAITDPVDQGLEVFSACYERIDRCVDVLAQALSNRSVAP